MNKITNLATEVANTAEDLRDDTFQLREYIKQKIFDAYRMGMADTQEVWEKNLREKELYERNNFRL